MTARGKYFKSAREWRNYSGDYALLIKNGPCIHITGSVKGMRKLFWGYSCDVVRIGNYIYKAN